MFQNILIPLDGSSRAEKVLPVAARIAQAGDGTISLLQAVWPPSLYMASVGEVVLPDILDESVEAARIYLESVANKGSLEFVRTETQVAIGHPAEAILATAKADNSDLVVMCSHGYTGEMRWSMGSIAVKVARHVSSPIFILYEHSALLTEVSDLSHRPLRILVPLDGSQHAEAILPKAAMLATALAASSHGELHLIHVVSTRDKTMNSIDEEFERTRHYLHDLVERVRKQVLKNMGVSQKLHLSWSITKAEDTASGIIHAAELYDKEKGGSECQVIAMTAHGQGGLQLWSLGHTTERVLQAARKPILVMH